jgi:hypothetical protein
MTENNPLSNQLMRATLAKFEAERQEALATMALYLNVPVGVGDHPTVVSELCAATARLATAEESIAVLQRTFLAPDDDDQANA